MAVTRLRGNARPVFTMKIGAGAATDLSEDLKSVSLSSEDKDDSDLTFAEAAAGTGIDWTLEGTAVLNFETGSLWNYLWTNAGVSVTFVYGPFGNVTPTATKPHFTGTVNVGRKPGLEVEAGTAKSEGAEFEFALSGESDVTKVIA